MQLELYPEMQSNLNLNVKKIYLFDLKKNSKNVIDLNFQIFSDIVLLQPAVNRQPGFRRGGLVEQDVEPPNMKNETKRQKQSKSTP